MHKFVRVLDKHGGERREVDESDRVLYSYHQYFTRSCYSDNDLIYVSVFIAEGQVLYNV